MDVKTGGGGKPERYDENTGKYVDNNGGSQKYKAEVKISDEDIIKAITSGEYGQELLDIYNVLNDDERIEFLQDIKNDLSDYNTSQSMETRYEPMTSEEFREWGNECEGSCNSSDLSAFYNEYRGAGAMAFEFNKALRLGLDKFYQVNPQFANDSYLSKNAILKRAQKFDNLTHSFSAPRNFSAYRYVDNNYLVSQFKNYFTDDIKIQAGTEDTYWYDTISSSTPIEAIYNCIKQAKGDIIEQDNGFTSFSCLEGNTHMGKHSGAAFKPIKLIYDIDKGQNCFISTYSYESEGIFPRQTSFFVKDVKLEKQDGGERILIYYGIR